MIRIILNTDNLTIYRHLRGSGNLKRPGGVGRPRIARTEVFEVEVLHRLEDNSSINVHTIAHNIQSMTVMETFTSTNIWQ